MNHFPVAESAIHAVIIQRGSVLYHRSLVHSITHLVARMDTVLLGIMQ
jgi:hypothetical protein